MRFAEHKTSCRFKTVEDVSQPNLPARNDLRDRNEQTRCHSAMVLSDLAADPASDYVGAETRSPSPGKSLAIWVLATMFFAVIVMGSSFFAQLGYDWGYTQVQQFIGQPNADDQGEGAIMLRCFIIPTITAGLFAGYMRGLFGGCRRWFAAVGVAAFAIVAFFAGDSITAKDLIELSVPAGIAASAAGLISIPVARLAKELKKRTRAVRLQACLLPAIVPLWVFFQPDSLVTQFMLYSTLMFAVGLLAPLATRSRSRGGVMASVFFATLPVTVFNLTNIGFTLFSMIAVNFGFLNIGWHATLSAVMISLTTLAASMLGGVCGGTIVRLKFRST